MASITIDQVTDNGDNSLTIIGHDTDGTEYVTSIGRKSDLPSKEDDQMSYYLAILAETLSQAPIVLYEAPAYATKLQTLKAEKLAQAAAAIGL